MTPIALKLYDFRLAKGWSQALLARTAGVSRATVNRLENGRPASIDFAVLEKLADALEVDAAMLIAHEHKPTRRRR